MLNAALKLNSKVYSPDVVKVSLRDGYGEALLQLGKTNKNVIAMSADFSTSTKSRLFEREFPNRFIQVGVAEQNMAGIAAGIALSGKTVFMATVAAFNPGRNWEQIRYAIAYSNANVKIVGTHAGFSDGGDGASHQALEDVALVRVIPNMTVIVPCDANQIKSAVNEAAQFHGPVYIRMMREPTPLITTIDTPFEIGKIQKIKEGSDITIIACGPVLYEAMNAAKKLEEERISCEILNCHTIKPLDEEEILKSVKKTTKVITVEEGQVIGGLGSAVAELLSEKYPTKMIRVGVKDKFGESGEYNELLKKYSVDSKTIIKSAKLLLEGVN